MHQRWIFFLDWWYVKTEPHHYTMRTVIGVGEFLFDMICQCWNLPVSIHDDVSDGSWLNGKNTCRSCFASRCCSTLFSTVWILNFCVIGNHLCGFRTGWMPKRWNADECCGPKNKKERAKHERLWKPKSSAMCHYIKGTHFISVFVSSFRVHNFFSLYFQRFSSWILLSN